MSSNYSKNISKGILAQASLEEHQQSRSNKFRLPLVTQTTWHETDTSRLFL